MKEWLPEIIKMKADSTLITAEMLGKIQLTQQRLLNLAETADNSSAQVGALRANVEAIVKETDIRFRTGQIVAVPEKVEGQHVIILKMWKPDAETGDGDKVHPS